MVSDILLFWTSKELNNISWQPPFLGSPHFKGAPISKELNNISWQPPFLGSPYLKGAPISKELNNISREFFLFFMEVSCSFKFFKLHLSILAKT